MVALAVFMTNLDLWIVNVAFDDLTHSFPGSSLAHVSWVLNAYAVTLGALLVVAGRAGDRYGHRRVFLVGTAVFTLASLACALAPTLDVLIGARVVQAAGAALQLPSSLALLVAGVEVGDRVRATRAWAAVGGIAAATGPVLGGLLVEASWRWVFLVNLPIGVLGVVAGRRVLPHPQAHPRTALPDPVAAVLAVLGIGSLVAGLLQGPAWGWTSAGTLTLFALALVSSAVVVRRCLTQPVPLVEPSLVRARGFARANAALFVFSIAFAIMLVSNALWCQQVWGYGPLLTGLAMVPGPALVPITTIASRRLVERVGPGALATVGSLLFGLGFVWRATVSSIEPNYLVDLLPAMVIGGIGVGLALGTLMAAGTTSLPTASAATGSALLNASRQVASGVGVAVLVTILTSWSPPSAPDAYRASWWVAAGLSLAAAVGAAFLHASHRSGQVAVREVHLARAR
ncbi:MFS transporter [Angustibacter luteus]|uniref:MFS transporter n=1 Tax=Angustibacter luteus TaxID=658456 RepID=A0ABW1JJ26_9ACTN